MVQILLALSIFLSGQNLSDKKKKKIDAKKLVFIVKQEWESDEMFSFWKQAKLGLYS